MKKLSEKDLYDTLVEINEAFFGLTDSAKHASRQLKNIKCYLERLKKLGCQSKASNKPWRRHGRMRHR